MLEKLNLISYQPCESLERIILGGNVLITTPPLNNLDSTNWSGMFFGRCLEGLGDIFGVCLGRLLGHVWGLGGILRGVQKVVENVLRG